MLWLVPATAIIGFASGLLQWAPALDEATFRLALIAIVAPALGEELLFRAAMLPAPQLDSAIPWRAILWSTALFIAWHPVQVFIHGEGWARIVLDPAFLVCAGLLGIACARLYWRSGSIWPAVLLHWVVVVAWKALFGAPSP